MNYGWAIKWLEIICWNPNNTTLPKMHKNLRNNVALPSPCIWLIKGLGRTLTSSFSFCLQEVSALLRFLLKALSLFAIWQPPPRRSCLNILPRSVRRCYCAIVWLLRRLLVNLGLHSLVVALIKTLDYKFFLLRGCWSIRWDSVRCMLRSQSFLSFLQKVFVGVLQLDGGHAFQIFW